MMICSNGELSVRKLEYEDRSLLVKWLSDAEVLKYYEGRDNVFDMEKVEEKFYRHIPNKTSCIIEYSKSPIGYIQFYTISDEEREEYGYENFQGSIYGTDQFIGETHYWDRGIGKLLMKIIIDFLINEKGVNKIVLDPQCWNERAIKCYEKSGYKKVKLLSKHELHEGELRDCWLMEYDLN